MFSVHGPGYAAGASAHSFHGFSPVFMVSWSGGSHCGLSQGFGDESRTSLGQTALRFGIQLKTGNRLTGLTHRAAMRSRDRSRAPVDVNSSMVRATWLSLRQSSSKMAIRSAYPPYLPQTEHQPTALCVCLLGCLRQLVFRYCGLIRRHPTGHPPVGTQSERRPTANAQCLA